MRRWLVFLALLNGFALADPISALNRFLDRMDSAEVSMLDTNYVTLYPEWWRIAVSGFWSNSNLNVRERDPYYGTEGNMDGDSKTRVSGSLSFRNWGISYTWDINHLDDNLNLSYIGNVFGAELQINRVYSLEGNLDAYQWAENEDGHAELAEYVFDIKKKDMHFLNILTDFYYVFNNDEFSYAAAISQSHKQKKSAGSWIMSGAYTYSNFKGKSSIKLAQVSGVDHIKFAEFSYGFGYGYNFVYNAFHNSQFLIHFSLIPTLALWDHYECKFRADSQYEEEYGSTFKESEWAWENFKLDSQQLVWFFRSSFTYTYKQFFAGVYNMFVRQTLSTGDDLDFSLDVWTIKAFVGIRL